MATTYHLHQLVWVKQEGYPWWPGIVYDPSQLDDHTNTHDEDGKLCILCLPTSASTVLFVDDAQDVEIIRPFRGPSVDDGLVAEGLASDDGEEGSCAAAVREALTLFAKQDADSVAAGSSSIHVDEPHPSTLKDAAMERKRPRRSDDDGSDHEEDDLLLLDANSDELHQKKKKASDDVGRQRTMDEFFEDEAKKEPPQFFADNDRDYYTKHTKGKKATDAQLVELREHITAAIAHCLSHGSYEEKQDEILGYLRQLANVVVSLDQLTSIQIGVVVGQLLKRSFPARINQLAQAVLECWYSQLPDAVRQSVVTNSELDRCSNDTNAEARSDRVDASLGAVGVHLFESFTDEEIFSAPLGVDLVQLCKEIEVLLMEKANNDADLRIMLLSSMADAACAPVRQALIDGIISTEDIVDNARDLLALVRPRGNKTRHGLRLSSTNLQSPVRDGSVGSPNSPASPEFSSPTGRNTTITTLYPCPSCGASEAYRSVYSVQAHDSFPEVLRCRKCNSTWNIADG